MCGGNGDDDDDLNEVDYDYACFFHSTRIKVKLQVKNIFFFFRFSPTNDHYTYTKGSFRDQIEIIQIVSPGDLLLFNGNQFFSLSYCNK